MAKLYFRYAAMGSGKSSALLQAAHNYKERNMNVLLFTPEIDDRYGKGIIKSRIGIESPAIVVDKDFNIFNYVKGVDTKISCVLVDEIQFFTIEHINQLSDIVDELNIPVICYGLRADFRAELFPSIQKLFAIADEVEELKTICDCGRKATINSRYDENGRIEISGNQIEVGDKQYKSVCRRCYKKKIKELENIFSIETAETLPIELSTFKFYDQETNKILNSGNISNEIIDDVNTHFKNDKLLKYECSVEDLIFFIYRNGCKRFTTTADEHGTHNTYIINGKFYNYYVRTYEYYNKNNKPYVVYIEVVDVNDLPF